MPRKDKPFPPEIFIYRENQGTDDEYMGVILNPADLDTETFVGTYRLTETGMLKITKQLVPIQKKPHA